MNEGWIKLHRCLFEKSIWQSSTPEHKVILITLLGMANHLGKEWEWKGNQFKANPGEFVTSANSIIEKSGTGITRQNVRSALKKFEKYGFLTYETTKTGMHVTIVNWGLYQGKSFESNQAINQEVTNDQPTGNQRPTNDQPTGNQQVTTNKNDKNIKNDNNDKELGEGEENKKQLPSFPTPIHELIFNQFKAITYETFFQDSVIEEKEHLIIITVQDMFKKKTIESGYAQAIGTLTGKSISVKSEEGE
jgi:DNA replication protein DnaD